MRLFARAVETRCEVVDPPTRLPVDPGDGFEQAASEAARAISCCAVAMTRVGLISDLSDQSHRLDEEKSRPHARQDRQASLGADFGGPAETKKARSVVASSRVPRLAGFAGSPPAAGLPRAVDWPLVQIPADRHTTTGTCVLGGPLCVRNRASAQGVSSARANYFASG